MIAILAEHSEHGISTQCTCYYSPMIGGTFEEPSVFVGQLGEVIDLTTSKRFSPSNFWPEDRSWFIYTDYDLFGTKVSGSSALARAVDSQPELETWHLAP